MTSGRPASPPPWLMKVEAAVAADLKKMLAAGTFAPVASILRRRAKRSKGLPPSRMTVNSAAYDRTPAGDCLRCRGMLASFGVSDTGMRDFVAGFALQPLSKCCPACRGTGVDGRGRTGGAAARDFERFAEELRIAFEREPIRGALQEFYSSVGKSGQKFQSGITVPYRLEFRAERLFEEFAPISDAGFVFGPRQRVGSIRMPPPLVGEGSVVAACSHCGGGGLMFEDSRAVSRV